MQLTFPGYKAVPSLVLVRRDLQRENARRQPHAFALPGCASCASFNSISDSGDNGSDGDGDSDGTTSAPRPEGTAVDAQIHHAATLPARGWTVHGPPPPPLRRAHSTGSSGCAAARFILVLQALVLAMGAVPATGPCGQV